MARMCGVLRIALREDDPGTKIRLAAEDIRPDDTVGGNAIEPGLYFCGKDAWDKFAPRMLSRLKKTLAVGHDGKPILGADGKPAMYATAEATLQSIDPRLLM